MFGRVAVFKNELKFSEFDTYRAFYCGICSQLRQKGYLEALSLNYDMTFLAIVLNSLYDAPVIKRDSRCICHMVKKHSETTDKYTSYIADMTILLSYYKCLDDFSDDKSLVKLTYSSLIKKEFRRICSSYPEKSEKIRMLLEQLSLKEKTPELEECANLFGHILGEIFTPNNDEWTSSLYKMGFYLGKFIYIADAYEDISDDLKHNRPNPLSQMYKAENFSRECEIILNMMACECAAEFEKLPIIDNAGILRNIIYSGIWQKLNFTQELSEHNE